MEMIGRGTVTGFTQFKGDIEGESIEANTLFVLVSIGSMGKGMRSAARKCQDAEVLKKISHLPFPFEAELVMQETATAKKEQMVVVEVRPLQRAPGAKAA